MAFCSHCGKNVTEQAIKCLACGKDLKAAKPAAAKFKGTMMMQAPAPQAAAASPAAPPAAAAVPPAAASPATAAAAPPAAEAPKMTLKGTMIGGMAAMPAPVAAPAAAPVAPAAAPAVEAKPQPGAGAGSQPNGDDDGGPLLVGDPMAPAEPIPAAKPIQRPHATPAYTPPAARQPDGNGRMLLVAVAAMLVMAAIAAGVARQMGLF